MKLSTGVPVNPRTRKTHPTVTGVHTQERINHGGVTKTVDFIVTDEDVYTDVTDVKPAGRRAKETSML